MISTITCLIILDILKESRERTVDLPEDDVDTVRRMITFMYTEDYDGGDPKEGQGSQAEEFEEAKIDHGEHATAEECISIVLDRLQNHARPAKDHNSIIRVHLGVYLAADKYGINDLKDLVIEKLVAWTQSDWSSENFLEIALDMMRAVPAHDERIGKMLVEAITEHIDHFVENDELVLKQLFVDNTAMAATVLEDLIEQHRIIAPRKERISHLMETAKRYNKRGLRTCRCKPASGAVAMRDLDGEYLSCSRCDQIVTLL